MATWPSSLGNPQLSGYDLETTDPTVRTDMEGGSARVRRRYTAAPDTVSLKFLFDAAQMATFRTFWDYDMANGSAWVYMPVKTGYVAGLESRECRPINGIFKSVPVSATHWLVEFQVEVRRGVYVWYDTINAMKLPSLELDFAGTQSLNSALTSSVQPVASVEFSRASVATYIGSDGLIKTAEVNEARFDFEPVTRVCKGLLIEEARTNLLTYSEFQNGVYTAGGVLQGTMIGPTGGTVNAAVFTSGSAQIYLLPTSHITLAASTTYAVSVFVKMDDGGVPVFNGAWITTASTNDFVLIVGNSPVLSQNTTAQHVGNGLYRVSGSVTTGTTNLGNNYIFRYSSNSGRGFKVTGWQIETGAFPTSYIPTTSAQVTRSADSASITGTNFSSWYRQDEGSFVVDWVTGGKTASAEIIHISDGASSNVMQVARFSSGGLLQYSGSVGGVAQWSISPSGYNIAGAKRKTAVAYKANDLAQVVDGVLKGADSSASIPVVTRMDIGMAYNGGNNLCGHIARLTYFPKRLSNAELQALSA